MRPTSATSSREGSLSMPPRLMLPATRDLSSILPPHATPRTYSNACRTATPLAGSTRAFLPCVIPTRAPTLLRCKAMPRPMPVQPRWTACMAIVSSPRRKTRLCAPSTAHITRTTQLAACAVSFLMTHPLRSALQYLADHMQIHPLGSKVLQTTLLMSCHLGRRPT
jgi:hypothetical protein